MHYPDAPQPEDLTPDDLRPTQNPIADYHIRTVSAWQARLLRERVEPFALGRRMAAATLTGAWETAQSVLDQAEQRGLLRELVSCLVGDLALLALRAAGGDVDVASRYFETLLRHQEQLNEGRKFQ